MAFSCGLHCQAELRLNVDVARQLARHLADVPPESDAAEQPHVS